MKATLNTSDLSGALALASRCISRKMSLPELSCVLIQPDKDALLVSASDLDRNITVRIPAEISSPAFEPFLCSAERLKMAISEHADKVELKSDGKKLGIISSGGASKAASLMILDASQFPALLQHAGGSMIDSAKFSARLRTANAGTEQMAGRDAISCVRVEATTDGLKFIATNGRGMSVSEMERPEWDQQTGSLPLAVVADLIALLPDEGEVRLAVGERTVSFEHENIIYAAKLLDISYPQWEQVAQKPDKAIKVKLERERLLQAMQEVAGVESENKSVNGGRIRWECGGKTLKLSARNESDEIVVDLELLDKCKPHVFSINGLLVIRHLRTWSADEINLFVGDELSPVMFQCADSLSVFTVLRPQ